MMTSFRVPSDDPTRLCCVLAELPPGFAQAAAAAIGQAAHPLGRFRLAHLRRRDDGSWRVLLRFDRGEPVPGADLAALVAPILALPAAAEPPDLRDAGEKATGTVIR
jgi:hypothetical protein